MKRSTSPRILPVLGLPLLLVGLSNLQAASIAAQWKFDDAANATGSVSSTGAVPGTFNGVATRTPNGGGVSGAAGDYAFDVGGTNGAMVVNPAAMPALNAITATQAMSISYWQFLDATPSSTAFWGQSASSTGSRGLNAHSPWSDGNVYWDTSGCCAQGPAGSATRIAGALGATIGVWQHITFTYENGTKNIYRDSTLIATNPVANPIAEPLKTDFTAFIVGNDMLMATLGMDAKLDNFTVWNGALTAAEVRTLSIRPVPEPTVALLGIAGLLGAAMRRRRCAAG